MNAWWLSEDWLMIAPNDYLTKTATKWWQLNCRLMRLQVVACRLKNINIDNTRNMFRENFIVHIRICVLWTQIFLLFCTFSSIQRAIRGHLLRHQLETWHVTSITRTTMYHHARGSGIYENVVGMGRTNKTTIKELRGWPSTVTAPTFLP